MLFCVLIAAVLLVFSLASVGCGILSLIWGDEKAGGLVWLAVGCLGSWLTVYLVELFFTNLR